MIGTRVRATNALQVAMFGLNSQPYFFPRDLVFCSVHAQEPDLAENVQRRAVARCEHAIVVVGSETVPAPTADIPDAEPVVFGKDGEGVEAVANQAANELKLGQGGLENVLRMAAIAEGHGMPLLVRFGDTRSYAVYHPGHRSIAEGWAVVLCEVDMQGGAGGARTNRRTATKKSSQSFRCKVSPSEVVVGSVHARV